MRAQLGPGSGQVSDEVGRPSWQRYLIDQGGLADWVDRGQPRPDHRAWHRYLRWVAGAEFSREAEC